MTPRTYILRIDANLKELRKIRSSRLFVRIPRDLERVMMMHQGRHQLVPDTPLRSFCSPAFMYSPLEANIKVISEVWIMGIPIFREFSIAFDRKEKRIGFSAQKKKRGGGKVRRLPRTNLMKFPLDLKRQV